MRRAMKRGTILVVDDDDDMRDLVVEVLCARGLDAIRCADADTAMAALPGADAVVTDVNLAAHSGLELCDRIAVARPGLPIVVISGDAGARSAAMRSGAVHFLAKPVDVGALATLLLNLTVR